MGKGGGGTLLEIRLKESLGSFIDLRAQAGRLLCSQVPPLVCDADVTLDRREAHTEGASGFAFAHPPFLYGFDYLPSEVFGAGFHPSPWYWMLQCLCMPL